MQSGSILVFTKPTLIHQVSPDPKYSSSVLYTTLSNSKACMQLLSHHNPCYHDILAHRFCADVNASNFRWSPAS